MLRVRYAPSPTGEIHIGNARTALFNYLFARHNNGSFIIRLDDTDKRRSTDEAIESMVKDITWLGLEWDEGYLKGGEYGPYRQSERMDIYNHYVDILLQNGSAYELFFTEEEIQNIKEECDRTLTSFSYRKIKENETEIRRRDFKEKGIPPAVVFKVQDGIDIRIDDLVRGEVHFNSSEFNDFVIRRSNGIPVYNYATVIDDALMKITHVIRAEEHLSNTPKQILIFKALNFELPQFAHISLILAPDRTKLSKRHGATSIGQFKDMGILPEALFNFLALLGWSPKDNREFFTKEELINLFTLDSVNKAPAVFDMNKLLWMNHKYIERMSSDEIYTIAKNIGVNLESRGKEWWLLFINNMKEHFNTLKDVELIARPILEEYNINDETLKEIESLNSRVLLGAFLQKIAKIEKWDKESILDLIRETGRELMIKGRQLYFPIRLAITGKEEGIEVHEYIYFIGKEEAIMRLKRILGGINA